MVVEKKWEYCGYCGYDLFPLDTRCDKCGAKTGTYTLPDGVKKADKSAAKSKSMTSQPAKVTPGVNDNQAFVRRKIEPATKNNQVEEDDKNTKKLVISIVCGVLVVLLVFGIIIYGVSKVKGMGGDGGASSHSLGSSFNSEITIPSDVLDELGVTDFYIDEIVDMGAAESYEYNDDGSITIKFTKVQYKLAKKLVKESLERLLKENLEYEYYTDVTNVTPDSNFRNFKVYTETDDPDMYDEYLSMDLFSYARIYAAFENVPITSIHIDLYDSHKKKYHSFDYSGDEEEYYEDEYYEDEYYEDEYYEDEYIEDEGEGEDISYDEYYEDDDADDAGWEEEEPIEDEYYEEEEPLEEDLDDAFWEEYEEPLEESEEIEEDDWENWEELEEDTSDGFESI